MSDKPKNIKAFPANHEFDNGDFVSNQGMTLLDYFAAKALAALMVRSESKVAPEELPAMIENLCANSYYIANKMLKEREKHI